MSEIYIIGNASISAQNPDISSWEASPVKEFEEVYKCIEPTFDDYLDPRATRRMSRIMKMGLTCALICLKNAGVGNPDAILTATGFGCLEDTAAFLNKLDHNENQFLNPTAFIQSTHNTVAGAIALHLKCHNYNNTFSHLDFSFESAITEALLLLDDINFKNILVGGIDENIDQLNLILKKFRNLRNINDKTYPIGEGTAFFLLSKQPAPGSVKLNCFKTLFTSSVDDLNNEYTEIIMKHGSPDIVLLGMNGNPANDKNYNWIYPLLGGKPAVLYKQYCGEYPTSAAFAHWMGCKILTDYNKLYNSSDRILIYNQFQGKNHSFTFLSK